MQTKFFSKINLSKGYWQITIQEDDIAKTAFVTADGSCEFLEMTFGMINLGAKLKRVMKKLTEGLDDVDFYWDDILVHTCMWKEHIRAIRELFSRLVKGWVNYQTYEVPIRSKQCGFSWPSIGARNDWSTSG